MKNKKMKFCLVCSHGGHFKEMIQILEALENYEYFFVTYESPATRELSNAYLLKFHGWDFFNKFYEIKTFYQSVKILYKEKPNGIITTGGGEISFPFCFIGKIMGIKIIFIDTLARITTKSWAGRLIYPFADLFLVQWEQMKYKYGKKAKYWGKVI
jgi:UDP-N-acetylglucosamine:LPS N-acetylglucosamine transferase